MSVFPPESIARFAANYPETPHTLQHRLRGHRLFSIEALAELADSLPAGQVEHNRADSSGRSSGSTIPPGEVIRSIGDRDSWVVIRNIEQSPEYSAILHSLLDELRPAVEPKTGPMLSIQGFVFVTSPSGVTSFHFDPEHNVLLMLEGSKEMTQFAPTDEACVPQEAHEQYHRGGSRDLPWMDACEAGGVKLVINPGDALFVPVMAPHIVANGPTPTIALSITWRSEWSYAEADARAFNSLLRKAGMTPRAPGRWPARNLAKAYAWRLVRKLRAA